MYCLPFKAKNHIPTGFKKSTFKEYDHVLFKVFRKACHF